MNRAEKRCCVSTTRADKVFSVHWTRFACTVVKDLYCSNEQKLIRPAIQAPYICTFRDNFLPIFGPCYRPLYYACLLRAYMFLQRGEECTSNSTAPWAVTVTVTITVIGYLLVTTIEYYLAKGKYRIST